MSVMRRRNNREPLNQIAGPPDTVPSEREDTEKQVERPAGEPTHDDIARRAYKVFEERGGEPGREWEDWFVAERELWTAHGRGQ